MILLRSLWLLTQNHWAWQPKFDFQRQKKTIYFFLNSLKNGRMEGNAEYTSAKYTTYSQQSWIFSIDYLYVRNVFVFVSLRIHLGILLAVQLLWVVTYWHLTQPFRCYRFLFNCCLPHYSEHTFLRGNAKQQTSDIKYTEAFIALRRGYLSNFILGSVNNSC